MSAEHDSLPNRIKVARFIGTRVAEVVLPHSTINDPHGTLPIIAEKSRLGRGHIFVFNHFGWGDPVHAAFNFFFATPGLKNMELVTPQSLHQYKSLYAAIMDIFGCHLVAVANQNTLDRPQYADLSLKVIGAMLSDFADLSAKALGRGQAVGFAINAGRSPFLDMDDVSLPLGTLMKALKKRKVTDYGVISLALALPKATSYDKRQVGGTNFRQPYAFTLGEYQTAEDLLAQTSSGHTFAETDGILRQQLQVMVPENHRQPPTFNSVAIVGAAGQTGSLLLERIAKKTKDVGLEAVIKPSQTIPVDSLPKERVVVSTNLVETLSRSPEAMILATANPTRETLEQIANSLKPDQELTLILLQNGVEVVDIAREVFAGKKVHLIRASLFSPVSQDKAGKPKYNASKLRIGLAAVPETSEAIYTAAPDQQLKAAKALFVRSGFDVEIFDDYRSMEWTKLILNCLGATGAITGLSHENTFSDPDLFALEARALQDHIRLLEILTKVEGIEFAPIPWQNASLLKKLQHVPIPLLQLGRRKFARMISKGRLPEPPSAARKIAAGKPTETYYYHRPFADLATKHGVKSLVDEAILKVMDLHQTGEINLAEMSLEARKQILLDVFNQLKVEVESGTEIELN